MPESFTREPVLQETPLRDEWRIAMLSLHGRAPEIIQEELQKAREEAGDAFATILAAETTGSR